MSAQVGGRRPAAILAADVVDYSRLIGVDEPGTLAKLAALRTDVIDPQIAGHGGRVFKTTGDGLLAEFASRDQAVQCAIAIRHGAGRRFPPFPGARRALHAADLGGERAPSVPIRSERGDHIERRVNRLPITRSGSPLRAAPW